MKLCVYVFVFCVGQCVKEKKKQEESLCNGPVGHLGWAVRTPHSPIPPDTVKLPGAVEKFIKFINFTS